MLNCERSYLNSLYISLNRLVYFMLHLIMSGIQEMISSLFRARVDLMVILSHFGEVLFENPTKVTNGEYKYTEYMLAL